MAYVITELCSKDALCVDVCPVYCFHPRKDEAGFEESKQLFVSPDDCIDCGACVPVCPVSAIFPVEELPDDFKSFVEVNASHYCT